MYQILSMQQAIRNFVKRNLPKDENNTKIGTMRGNKVIIGNKSYRANIVNDMWLEDGDQVCCIIPDSGNLAVVVGKL